MSVKQPLVPSAFEIRFSASDSTLEVFEIQQDQNSQNVPDPFKKRDKIPRSSGSIEQFSNVDNNNSGNTTQSQVPPIILKQKQRHHSESSSKKGLSTNSDQVSSPLKVKPSNAVGPEADKQQRINGGVKNLNVERSNSLGNDMIMTANSMERKNILEDDTIIRHPNKKQRPKVDESEKEKDNLDKGIILNHQIMDLNGRTEPVISNNKKIMTKQILKNNKFNTSTNSNNYKDDENKPLPKDGIATPPATPPRSPQIISQKRSEDGITTNQMNLYDSQPETPPSSSDSAKSITGITRPTRISQSSRKRRASQSPQKSQSMLSTKRSIEMSAYQPPKKLQHPRGRRLSSASGQIITAEQPQESFTTTQSSESKEIQKSQQSQPPIRSRIPRLSTSSRERPTIGQKVSQGSLSSQGSDKFNESKELSSSYPPRQIRLSTSRPIINTSLISDVETRSESPTGYLPTDYSPTDNSSTDHSPTSHSPTNPSPTNSSPPSNYSIHQKKFISHDDVVIPTIAKQLKMKGQLNIVSHDALLGFSEEPEDISPMSENGYMDITDQVVNLFDGPKIKSHKRQSSIPRKNSSTGHSRNASKTHYIAPRQPPQQSYDDVPSPTGSQFENSSEHSAPSDNFIRNKRGRARREEYIISVREDNDDVEFIEPRSSMTLVPSEPSTVPTVQTVQVESHDQIYQEKVEEPEPVQISVVQETEYNVIPAEAASAPTVTSGNKKKDKKKKQKKSSSGNLDEDDYVRKSRCRCAIQ